MLIDLSDRAKLNVTGADRVRFLNGQLPNDIVGLQPGSAIYACALTAKGKLCADLFVGAKKGGLFLDTEAVLRESLTARLEKYIIADDVTLEDVTEAFGLFHLVDVESEECVGVSAHRRFPVDHVPVAAATPLPSDVSGLDQVSQDALRGSEGSSQDVAGSGRRATSAASSAGRPKSRSTPSAW